MNIVRQIVLLSFLSYAAWTDFQRGVIDDKASLGIFLCSPSIEATLYGLTLAILLFQVAQKTQRLGEGDSLLLGSLGATLSSQEFVIVCCGSTALMSFGSQILLAKPLAPYLWVLTAIVLCWPCCLLP